MLWLIVQPPPPDSPPGSRAPVVSEWIDPRYESLAEVWALTQPPPGTAGFIEPRP